MGTLGVMIAVYLIALAAVLDFTTLPLPAAEPIAWLPDAEKPLDPGSPNATTALLDSVDVVGADRLPAVGAIAFSPDGQTLYAVDSLGAAWDLRCVDGAWRPGARPLALLGRGAPTGAAVSPDGNALLVADGLRGLFSVDTRSGAITALATTLASDGEGDANAGAPGPGEGASSDPPGTSSESLANDTPSSLPREAEAGEERPPSIYEMGPGSLWNALLGSRREAGRQNREAWERRRERSRAPSPRGWVPIAHATAVALDPASGRLLALDAGGVPPALGRDGTYSSADSVFLAAMQGGATGGLLVREGGAEGARGPPQAMQRLLALRTPVGLALAPGGGHAWVTQAGPHRLVRVPLGEGASAEAFAAASRAAAAADASAAAVSLKKRLSAGFLPAIVAATAVPLPGVPGGLANARVDLIELAGERSRPALWVTLRAPRTPLVAGGLRSRAARYLLGWATRLAPPRLDAWGAVALCGDDGQPLAIFTDPQGDVVRGLTAVAQHGDTLALAGPGTDGVAFVSVRALLRAHARALAAAAPEPSSAAAAAARAPPEPISEL